MLVTLVLLPATDSVASSPWIKTSSYPTLVDSQGCVTYSGFVYCVGGNNNVGSHNRTYYAPLSSSRIGAWKRGTDYPGGGTEQVSCVAYSGYIYCVGGFTGINFTQSVYFASVSSKGIGAWKQTTSYPYELSGESCAVNAGYIYCLGGQVYNSGYTAAAFYASLSHSGVGKWKQATNYPFAVVFESCVTNSGYLYCIGGLNTSNQRVDSVYYASVSSSGIGKWTKTTNYPTPRGEGACAAYSGIVYCVGGSTNKNPFGISSVYYAALKSSGVGTWKPAASYPTKITLEACVTNSGYLYCIGGHPNIFTSATYYKHLP
jgi:N-acetylneuraminic acid mutarotase